MISSVLGGGVFCRYYSGCRYRICELIFKFDAARLVSCKLKDRGGFILKPSLRNFGIPTALFLISTSLCLGANEGNFTPTVPDQDLLNLPPLQAPSLPDSPPPTPDGVDMNEPHLPEPSHPATTGQGSVPTATKDKGSTNTSLSSDGFTRAYTAYMMLRPEWSFEVTGAINALSKSNLKDSPFLGAGSDIHGISVQFEYQPAILQSFGIFSIGPEATIYPFTPLGSSTKSNISVWGVGGMVKYQARYFQEQIIVPFVGYMTEMFNYSFVSGESGHFAASGPLFGGMLLLNIFEPSAAAQMFIEHDIKRSYLLAEIRELQGSNDTVTLNGTSFFFGLRFEF